jgi:hypothetical protein
MVFVMTTVMVCVLPLINMTGRWHIWKQEGRGMSSDMLWLQIPVLQGFSHHECATASTCYNHNDNFMLSWFEAYAAMLMKSVVFWVITRRRVVIIYRRFGTTYRSHLYGSRFQEEFLLESWPVKSGPIRCPETSVTTYHTTPCNYPEDHRCHQHRGVSLKWSLWVPVVFKCHLLLFYLYTGLPRICSLKRYLLIHYFLCQFTMTFRPNSLINMQLKW